MEIAEPAANSLPLIFNIGGLPAVSVFENPFYGVDGMLKRICDVCLASVALTLGFVPMVLIACLIKLTSPGPIFFRQKRYDRFAVRPKSHVKPVAESDRNVHEAVSLTFGDNKYVIVISQTEKDSFFRLPGQFFHKWSDNFSYIQPVQHATG